jgi:hypothetical protein
VRIVTSSFGIVAFAVGKRITTKNLINGNTANDGTAVLVLSDFLP